MDLRVVEIQIGGLVGTICGRSRCFTIKKLEKLELVALVFVRLVKQSGLISNRYLGYVFSKYFWWDKEIRMWSKRWRRITDNDDDYLADESFLFTECNKVRLKNRTVFFVTDLIFLILETSLNERYFYQREARWLNFPRRRGQNWTFVNHDSM